NVPYNDTQNSNNNIIAKSDEASSILLKYIITTNRQTEMKIETALMSGTPKQG
ncbi:25959_t:CDS:1, partial [Gigaspora margarita]